VNQDNIKEEFNEEQQEVLQSIRVSRIIIPVLIGLVAVFYMLWQQFDPEEFKRIHWTSHTLLWILAAVGIIIIRHLSYAARLRILSEKAFSWRKCIELIFIWEFSSAVSPTSVGGSAVAFFVLAQEKLSTAKTATIVLYTIVLDSIFFIGTLPILFLIFGTQMIRPDIQEFSDLGPWGFYFLVAYGVMASYASFFYFGLFVSPKQIKNLLVLFTKIRFLKRYRERAIALGDDMIIASGALKKQKVLFHIRAFLATVSAWSCRFLLINCLIIAFIPSIPLEWWSQTELFARLETMFVIIAFSPTPGGAGFVEVLFGGFLKDYVNSPTYATLISTIWRLLTYYSYLFVGAIIIPNWIRTILNHRRKRK
jgi:uncharacterized protein (TIRG00374 family)